MAELGHFPGAQAVAVALEHRPDGRLSRQTGELFQVVANGRRFHTVCLHSLTSFCLDCG